MKTQKTRVHFADPNLLHPTNPVTVNVIGAGGTGSHVVAALTRIHESLNALGHPGLLVRLYDDDIVTPANKGRQLFADAEVGLQKSVALINRANRWLGTNWKAIPFKFNNINLDKVQVANIAVSCVDTVAARYEIAAILKQQGKSSPYNRDRLHYWMDFGNSRYTGQVILATIGKIVQPSSKKFTPVGRLPLPTEEFKDLLEAAKDDNTPSCSLAAALAEQDLFINSSLANLGASLLWQLFSEGMINNRGAFHNLRTFRTEAVKV
jgi:PRTRC genetic system ThiF family protein